MVDVLLLEDRVLFSASPVDPMLDDVDLATESSGTFDFEAFQLADDVSDPELMEGLEDDWRVFESLVQDLDHLNEFETHLLIVDERLETDSLTRELLRTSDENLEIVYLSESLDGIEQITAAIARHDDIDSIQIISHGSDGQLLLGDTLLSLANIDLYVDEITGWRSHLSADADLLLLGCNVASTSTGESFVAEFAKLTNADIAASSDLTGALAFGGDWDLEHEFGSIETGIALSVAAQDSFDGTLATITVDTTDDTIAIDGKTSLREAILLANALPDSDIIVFDILDALVDGAHTISLTSALPDIANNVTIDGTLEPQYAGTPVVFIDGSGIAGTADGVRINGSGAAGSEIRGLGIVAFDGHGIVIEDTSNVRIESNYIGVDASGTVDLGNTGSGIQIEGTTSVVIGGDTSLGNVISGNDKSGITVDGSSGTLVFDTHISGNFIGTNGAGTAALGNSEFGINVIGNTDDTLIGGTTDLERNIISGNAHSGIHIGDAADDTTVFRNFIGTDVTGVQAIGNGATVNGGIRIDTGATDSVIGSVANPNVIAHNVGSGVIVNDTGTSNHFIRGNEFFGNSAQPVDLGEDGLTSNDGIGDIDVGPNYLQNFTDELEASVSADGTLFLSGLVNSSPASTYLIDFYAGDTTTGAITKFIGTAAVNTTSGSFWFVVEFAATAVVPGESVYASIADQSTPSSSEFSAGVITESPGDIPTANDDGPIVTQSNLPTVLDVIANDVDPDGNDIRLIDVSAAEHGTVTASYSTGEVTYTSDVAFAGADDFRYRIGDDSDGTIHYWGFAGDANDSVGSMNGTLIGTPDGVAGEFGSGLAFDGTGDAVELRDIEYTDSFTLSFAFKVDDLTASGAPEWQTLFSHGSTSAPDSLNVTIGETGTTEAGLLRTILRDSADSIATSALDVDIAGLVGDTNWHTYTLVVSELGLATVYIDGEIEAITADAGNTLNPTGNAVIGGRSDGLAADFYSGSIDTIRVFDRNLSSFEVDSLHNDNNNIATASFTVVGNAPSISSPASEALFENIALVHEVVTTTPNNAPVTLSISGGDDAALFDIVAGELVFLAAPDFETPLDADENNEYIVEVAAANAFGSSQQLVTINIENVNEAPVAFDDSYLVDRDLIHIEPLSSGVLANDYDQDQFGRDLLGTETLQYDATQDTNANDQWETTDDLTGFAWDMSSPSVTYTETPTNAPSAVDAAWNFDGTGGASMNAITGLPGLQAPAPATFELWLNPADLADRDVVLDLGRNSFGTSLIIDGNQIELHTNGSGVTTVLTYSGPEIDAGEYVHIVAVIDPDGTTDGGLEADLQLFVNGNLVDEAIDIADPYTGWVNDSSDHGLGKSVGSMIGGPATSFEGEIAMVRYYEGALTVNEIEQQYDAVTNITTVTAIDGDSGAIGDWFEIASGALVRMNSDGSFDYDPNGNFDGLGVGVSAVDAFTYTVTDVASNSSVAEVTLTIAGINNAPTDISIGNDTIAENDPGAIIGLVTVNDVDLGDTHIFSIDDARFEVSSTGELKLTAGATLDFEGTNPFVIEITAIDRARNTYSESFSIFATDVNDTPDSISISNDSILEETDTTTALVVGTLSTTDQDAGDTFTYSIVGGDDELLFSLDGNDLLLSHGVLDFEAQDAYQVLVETSDSEDATLQQLITISVDDVNEAPELDAADNTFSIDENETAVGRVEADDPEMDTLTYSIVGGTDETQFGILPTGELFFLAAPDFERPTDADEDNVYEVDVQVTDGVFIDVERLTVTVLPVNDHLPVFVSDPFFEVDSGEEFVANLVATDDDLPGDSITYSVVGGFHADQFGVDGSDLIFKTPQIHQTTGNFRQVIVEADDGDGGTARQTIFVRIANAAPVAVDDSFETTNVGSFEGSVLEGDSDIDDTDLTVSLVNGPSSGTLQLNPDGSFEFEPDPEVEGIVQFEYQIQDPSGNTDNAIVEISVSKTGGPVDPGSSGSSGSSSSGSSSTDSSSNNSNNSSDNQPATDQPEAAGPDITSQREERRIESITLTEIANDFVQTVSIDEVETTDEVSSESQPIATTFAERLTPSTLQDAALAAIEQESGITIVASFNDLSTLDFGSRGITAQTSIEASQEVAGTVLNASVVTVSGVILGYLFWIIQSGVALSNLMTQLPMWNSFDPLPVLQFADAGDDDDESLEDFVRRQSKIQQTSV